MRAADFAKGFAVVALLAPSWSVGQALVLTAAIAGEQWPIFGKDVGRLGLWVAAGGVTALTPIAPVIWGIIWALGFVMSGYIVVGRALALIFFWAALGFIAGWPLGLIALPSSLMVLERSRDELRRIRAGGVAKHHWRGVS
jgi:glycerol-3-phosphate acyltransferase PlsY